MSKKTKTALGKHFTPGNVLGYSAAFVGSNMLFPGGFWQNSVSSAAFEATRMIANKQGVGGWKGVALGTAASLATSFAWSGLTPKSSVTDTEIFESLGGSRFSGHNSAFNTIEGLKDEGMRQNVRHSLTEFGSGYQGPNPWLNPEYNQAEEIEQYKLMRASKIGLSEKELYEYLTKEEPEVSEYVASTASAGSAMHLIQEAKALKSGQASSTEKLLYDPQAQITGHMDITDIEGNPLDFKTVSAKKLAEIQQFGAPAKNVHQLNWYMHMMGASQGTLRYINRANPEQEYDITVPYSSEMVQQDVARIERVRARIQSEIVSGKLDPSSLPKGPSVETLKSAAAEDAGVAARNAGNIPYLEEVYAEEMEYLNSVKPKENFRSKTQWRDKASQGGQRWSGKDDNYNTIEGLRHDGIAQYTRKGLTSFGSGWDAMRGIAKKVFSGKNEKEAFGLLRELPEFKTALLEAKQVKELSYGAYGTTSLMEGVFSHPSIGDHAFQFVKKIPETPLFREGIKGMPTKANRISSLENEFSALHKVEHRISPSPYGYDKESNSMFMELMPGKTIQDIILEGKTKLPRSLDKRIKKESSKAAKLGVRNIDIHTGNLMYDVKADRLSWIDFGMARTTNAPSKEWVKTSSGKMITSIKEMRTRVNANIKRLNAPALEEGFEDPFGDLFSPSHSPSLILEQKTNNIRRVPNINPFVATDKIDLSKTFEIEDSSKIKRMRIFRESSKASVGAGLKSAHNAGRGHCSSSSNRASNF